MYTNLLEEFRGSIAIKEQADLLTIGTRLKNRTSTSWDEVESLIGAVNEKSREVNNISIKSLKSKANTVSSFTDLETVEMIEDLESSRNLKPRSLEDFVVLGNLGGVLGNVFAEQIRKSEWTGKFEAFSPKSTTRLNKDDFKFPLNSISLLALNFVKEKTSFTHRFITDDVSPTYHVGVLLTAEHFAINHENVTISEVYEFTEFLDEPEKDEFLCFYVGALKDRLEYLSEIKNKYLHIRYKLNVLIK